MSTIFDRLQGTITGSDKQNLVLLHGFGADQQVWEPLRPWLSNFFTVASYNMAGTGTKGPLTHVPQRHHHLYGHVDDLLEILAVLKWSSVVFLGHSTAVMVGLAAATVRPDRFGHLIALQGLPRYLVAEDYATKLSQGDLNEMYVAMTKNHVAWANNFVSKTLGIDEPKTQEMMLRGLLSMSPKITSAMMRALFQADVLACLSRMRVPVHVLHAKQDPLTPLAAVRAMKRQLDRVTLDTLPVAGHVPHISQPEALKPILAGYLDIPFEQTANE